MQTAQNAPGAPAIRQEVPFFAKLISQEFSLKEAPSVESEDSGNTSLPAVPEASCQISDSVDTSLYKEKLDRLQRLVDQLQDKNRGLEILSACSLEGQQENKKLKSELRYFKSQVAQLQKRLGEVDKGSLDEFLQGVESHCSLPSFSADSFENLLRENVKLKQALRKAESYQRGPGSQGQLGDSALLQQRVADQEAEIQELKLRLQNRPMSLDSEQLQKQVELLSELLHQFSTQLKSAKESTSPTTGSPSKQGTDSENEALKSQIARLDHQLNEVIQMNARWQHYNTEREKYVQQLQLKLKESEESLASAANKTQISEEQQRQIDRLIQEHKKKFHDLEDAKIKVEDENRHLRQEVESYRQQVSHQDKVICALQSEISELKRNLSAKSSHVTSNEDKDTIEMLKAQVQICTEDFQSERRDRERAHQKISDLERELAITKQLLGNYQQQQNETLIERRRNAFEQYAREHQPHVGPSYNGSQPVALMPRGHFFSDGVEDTTSALDDDDYDEIDYPLGLSENRGREEPPPAQAAPKPDNTLQCPRCHREFPANQHTSLLEHIDVCCD